MIGPDPTTDMWIAVSSTVLDQAGLSYWSKELVATNTTINGVKGKISQVNPKAASEGTYGFAAFVLKKDTLLKIELVASTEELGQSAENEEMFSQILSTVKFTK